MEMRIKEILSEKGVSMDWLSKETNIAKETLYRIGSGNPTIGTLQKIADALCVPLVSLFTANCPNCGMKIYPATGVEIQPRQPEAKTGIGLLDCLKQFAEEKEKTAGHNEYLCYMALYKHLEQYGGDTTLLSEVNKSYLTGLQNTWERQEK